MSNENHHANLANPAVILATWFGAGHLPKAPGTWGSLAALPFAWVLHMADGWIGLTLGVVVCFGVGVWASNGYLQALGGDDPAPVVIDEVAGQWLTLLPAAYLIPGGPDWIIYAIGFGLFRLFDVFKPWPVSWADRQIKGGLGIMLDDIIAAVYGGAVLTGIIIWGGF
ncbi:MAG: phosphatidylglycerophosphatase A family protein [Alphaproteobacteria bacterium]